MGEATPASVSGQREGDTRQRRNEEGVGGTDVHARRMQTCIATTSPPHLPQDCAPIAGAPLAHLGEGATGGDGGGGAGVGERGEYRAGQQNRGYPSE
eukprot:scaffold15846_cov87-Isochrysis_galbana.AAC.3